MKGNGKAIYKFDSTGKAIGITKQDRHVMPTYRSISEAARREGIHRSNVQAYLRHGKDPWGNLWKLAEARP